MTEGGRPVDQADVMPPTWPYFTTTQEPTVYRDVAFQFLFFQPDDAAVAELLPSPLEVDGSRPSLVVTIDVPYASSYGPFQESWIQAPCTLRGAPVYYCPLVFLNNVRAIVAGREIWGTPKVWADVTYETRGARTVGRTVFEGHEIIELVTETGRPAQPLDLPVTDPCYRLKLIPSAVGPGPAIKQLVTAAALDDRLYDLTQGEGQVRFGSGAGLNLTTLNPRQVFDAFTFRMSFRETFGTVALDYLNQ